VQEVLIVAGSGAYVNVNIWNTTKVLKVQYCSLSPLNPASITGRGRVHHYTGSQGGCAGDVYIYASQVTPLGASAALEVVLSASSQGVTVSFYRDSGIVDSVRIFPSDGVSWAGFVVEPVLWEWSPLDAELVLAGRSSDYPTAVLESGAVTLKLSYFRENSWSLPRAAWSAGGNTFEKAVASVSQVVDGAARVTPGEPVVRQLWAFLVLVRTPLGVYYSTSLDISQFIVPVVDLGNGTRLVSPIVLYRNTSFSLAEAVATGPGVYRVVYRKQFLVRVTALNTTYEDWVDEGTAFEVKAPSFESRGVDVLPVAYEYSGKRQTSPSVVVREPLSVRVVYNATTRVTLTSFNLPALYAEVTLKCGSTSRRATLLLAWEASLTLGDVDTANCSVEYTSIPSWPLFPALIVTFTLIVVRVAARKRASRSQALATIAEFKAVGAPSSPLS